MFSHLFSHTELGVQALDALYRFYCKHRSVPAKILAARLGFELLEVPDIEAVGFGRLYPNGLLAVAENALPNLQAFVIYHELGHDCLGRLNKIFKETMPSLTAEERAEVEIVIDNFARAMIFASVGVRLMNLNSAHQFLRTNELDRKFESEEKFDAQRDLYQGQAISKVARKLFPKGKRKHHNAAQGDLFSDEDPFCVRDELIALGEFLSNYGTERLRKLKGPHG
jgi:hypothetical protein